MTAKEAIRFNLKSSDYLLGQYLSDLSDADLLVRPASGANHIAWQLGHVIATEATYFLPRIPGAVVPTLPEGFVEAHAPERSTEDSVAGYLSKAEYMSLRERVRGATLAALDAIADEELDQDPGLGWGEMAPTIGSVFLIIANHDLMHGGQFTVVRRAQGKPVLF